MTGPEREGELRGRTYVVTGASSGLGEATASELTTMGASVVMVCRSEEKGELALSRIKKGARLRHGGAENLKIALATADLSSLASVRGLADELLAHNPQIHVLVNNAGVFNLRRHVTADGYESTFAVNYLAPFLLTNLLLERLRSSAPARIVNVSSAAHYGGHIDFEDLQAERGYTGFRAYSQSKLALVLFTREIAMRLNGTGVTAYSLHPGTVATNIRSRSAGPLGAVMKIPGAFMTQPRKGAETSIYLASALEIDGMSGEYFEDMRPKRSSEESYDQSASQRLWDLSLRLARLDGAL